MTAVDLTSVALPFEDGKRSVPEHHVKGALAERGVSIPRGVTGGTPVELAESAAVLDGPFALKAFGPGLVHKSDVGAVALGVDGGDLAAAAQAMKDHLALRGLVPAGFLAEKMAPVGTEVLVGVVDRPPFGPVVALGLGGTLTEVLNQVALWLCPLDETEARKLVHSSPVAPLLDGVRGRAPIDQDALVHLLLAVAGPDGLAAGLDEDFAELECNPVSVSAEGVEVLDARLVLRAGPPAATAHSDQERVLQSEPGTDFTRLFRPRSVAVAGASTSKTGFGNRALAAYRSAGWTDGLYALHPSADEVDGVPAHGSVAELDDLVDYLLVTVPAARCAEVVRSTAGRVPFVHVVSGGFGEAGADGEQLGDDLLEAGRDVGARIIGPNCIGIYCPSGRQTFQLDDPLDEGTVSIVSQSGGLAGDIIKAGARRGVRFSKLATVGNALDVSPGELVDWLVDDPETETVGVYLEGSADVRRLVEALRRARGRLPVALLLGGQSRQGAAAVASHTGALAGDRRIWEAVAEATGITLVTTLEDLLAVLSYTQRWQRMTAAVDQRVLIVGVGGGASVLATDACARAGLDVAPIDDAVQAELRARGYGVGTSVANPLEIPFGPAAPTDALRQALAPVQSRSLDAEGSVQSRSPYADVMVHVNVQAYYSYGNQGVTPLIAQLGDLSTALWPGSRLAVVLRNLDCAPGADAERLRTAAADLGLALFRDLDEAATAIAAMKRFTAARQDVERSGRGRCVASTADPGFTAGGQDNGGSGRGTGTRDNTAATRSA